MSVWFLKSKIFQAIFIILLGTPAGQEEDSEYVIEEDSDEEEKELFKVFPNLQSRDYGEEGDYHVQAEETETFNPNAISCDSPYKSHPKRAEQKDSSTILKRIRELMVENKIDVIVITSRDEHGNLLLYSHDNLLYMLTGFTGYTSLAIIMPNLAYLFVREEWFKRAQFEVDCNWLIVIDNNDFISFLLIIVKHFMFKSYYTDIRIAVDSERMSHVMWTFYDDYLRKSTNERAHLVELPLNLKQELLNELKLIPSPDLTNTIINTKDPQKPTEWDDLLKRITKRIIGDPYKVDAYLISALDEIAWTLSLEGEDYKYTTLFKAHLLIVPNSYTRLFIAEEKLHETVTDRWKLKEECEDSDTTCIRLLSYDAVEEEIHALSSLRRWLVATNVNEFTYRIIKNATEERAEIVRLTSPIRLMMLESNPIEAKAMKDANVEEAKVWSHFVYQLEEDLLKDREDHDEFTVLNLLNDYHNSFRNFTIYGFPPTVMTLKSSLINDYFPTQHFSEQIDKDTMFMVKSGAHYIRGTAMLTRIFQFGEAPLLHRKIYTALVRSFLTFARLVFPEGTTDKELEPLIRAPLYDSGFYTYSRTSAHSIGPNTYAIDNLLLFEFGRGDSIRRATVLQPGMFIFFTPTVDIPNYCRLSLGNVFRVVSMKKTNEKQKTSYFRFAPITYFPFDPKLLMFEKLEPYELATLKTFYTKILLSVENDLRQANNIEIADWIAQQFETTPDIEECYIQDLTTHEIENF